MRVRIKKTHPLEWLLEPLEGHSGYLRKKMFGCEAVYIDGKLMIGLVAGDEPWNGILVATHRDCHTDLQKEWKSLQSHSVLGKWLYLSQTDPSFEETAMAIVDSVKRGDPRIGVEPKPRKKKSSRQTRRKSHGDAKT